MTAAQTPEQRAAAARAKLAELKAKKAQGMAPGAGATALAPRPESIAIIPDPVTNDRLPEGYTTAVSVNAEKLKMGYAAGALRLSFVADASHFFALHQLVEASDGFVVRIDIHAPDFLLSTGGGDGGGDDGE